MFIIIVFICTHRCGPCKNIAPTFSKLSTEYAAAAVFLKVDVDKCEVSKIMYIVHCMYHDPLYYNLDFVIFSY